MNRLKFAISKGIVYGCATIGMLYLFAQAIIDFNIIIGGIIFLVCIVSLFYDFSNN